MKRKPRGPLIPAAEPHEQGHPSLRPAGIHNGLVIRTGGLGDFILALPCIEAIRRRWPDSSIEILGRPSIAAIALNPAQADRVTSIDRSFFAGLFRPGPLDLQLREYLSGFDLVVSFLPDAQDEIRQRLASLGANAHSVAAPRPGSHACRQFLERLPFADTASRMLLPTVYLERQDRAQGEAILQGLGVGGPPRIVIHPGSGSQSKNWPAESFAQVAGRLVRAGMQVLFLEGEADSEQCNRTLASFQRAAPVISGLPVREVAGALSRCQLLIGNDSGISHLAAAVGLPVIALFGPTDPEVWRPLGPNVEIMRFSETDADRVAGRALEMIRA